MKNSSPFRRSLSMMAAISAIMAGGFPSVIAQAKISELGSYESRGKSGKRPHRPTGIAGVRRAAAKRRNVLRNRRQQRR